MKTVMIVLRKELVDMFRDRRTMLLSLGMGPLLTPMLLIGLMMMAGAKSREREEKPLELAIVGVEHAANLVEWLKGNNVKVKPAPDDVDEAVRTQVEDVVLRIGADYPEQWRAGLPATVEVVHDSSRGGDTEATVERVEKLLHVYGSQVSALRLVARGVAPTVSTPLAISHRDVATPESRMGLMLAFFPYLLILSGFLGGANLAIDSTAGERERQSLEPLLANPVSREAIMSGKMGAASLFAMLTLSLTLLALKAAFFLAPAELIGFSLNISWFMIAQLLLTLSTLVVFGACLLTLLAASAKSVKEAQSYMAFLLLLPMVPTMGLMVNPVKNQLWMFAVPFLSQNQMILKVVRGEAMTGAEWAVGLGTGAVLAAITWAVASRLYRREQLAISA
jgi:sodium transport system permease protein